jgi:transcription elongation factor Elf1
MTDKAVKVEKAAKKSPEIVQQKEVNFTCKFCGEIKPLVELVVMRQFFPAISSCKACAKATRNAPGT